MLPLEHDWSTKKPIIDIINTSLAFRYITSQIWKYYGIFAFVLNERGRIHEHKFRKQLSAQAFKVYSFVMWETCSESAHGHCLGGFVFKCATRGICCFSAGGYQTVLHYCGRPLLDWGWIACIRCQASCTEPKGIQCTMPPLIYVLCMCIYIYIYIVLSFCNILYLINSFFINNKLFFALYSNS